MTHEKVDFKNDDGQQLVGVVSSPDMPGKYPAVIFLHGFMSSKESGKAKELADMLPDKNMVFFTFDFRGCGESEGEFADITVSRYLDDARSALNFLATLPFVDPNRIALIGSSLGGMVALLLAADPRIKATVLLAPVSNFRQSNFFQDPAELEQWRLDGVKSEFNAAGKEFQIKYAYYTDGIQYDIYAEAARITCPTLIIHGDKDARVPLTQSRELIKHLRAALHVIAGGNHRFTKPMHFKEMIDTTIAFLGEKL